MKVLNCHESGLSPLVEVEPASGNLNDFSLVSCACCDLRCTIPKWNSVQRRKRMQKKWEIIVSEAGSKEGVSPLESVDKWLDELLTHFFGPAEGVEVEK